MILKKLPQDFRVEELTRLAPSRKGRFSLYRFEKTSVDHFTAVGRAARLLGVSTRQIRWGGIKDAAACTVQPLTVAAGVRRDAVDENIALTFLGRCDEPADAASFDANRFGITVRDLSAQDARRLVDRLQRAVAWGMPNYFDDQRFRHFATTESLVGRKLARGNYEEALKLVLTTYHRKEQQSVKRARRTVLEHWGNWSTCLAELGQSSERSIVTYLADHPERFDRALDLLPTELLLLHVSAYQSYLFNRVLARLIEAEGAAEGLRREQSASGEMVFYERLSSEAAMRWSTTQVELAGPKIDLATGPAGPLYKSLLKGEGLSPEDFRLRGLKKVHFGGSPRRAVVSPENLAVTKPQDDELTHNRLKLTATFELPRGSYATLLFRCAAGNAECDLPQPLSPV